MADPKQKACLKQHLRRLREKKHLTQYYCSFTIGCTIRTWRRWEQGDALPMPIYYKGILGIFPELADV